MKRILVFAHRWLGVVLSILVAMWFASGIVMMYRGFPTVDAEDRLQRLPTLDPQQVTLTAEEACAALGGRTPAQVTLTSFDGRPVYVGAGIMIYADDGTEQRAVDEGWWIAAALWSGLPLGEAIVLVRGEPSTTFDVDYLVGRLRRAAGDGLADLRVMEEYDAYYIDRRELRPLPVIVSLLNDSVSSRYYIDPRTATVVASYDATGWVDRWLYRGLHSLDFPWLYNNRPLWDVVVIGLRLGGTALFVTSLVLACRVIGRSRRSLLRQRDAGSHDEALAPEPDALLRDT